MPAFRRAALLLLALFGLLACGGDDPAPPGKVGSRNDDPPAKDARVEDEADAQVSIPDAAVEAGAPDPDEDAGPPRCSARQCRDLLNDPCNEGVCNADTGMCEQHPLPDGTACGDASSGECDGADSCQAGACSFNHASQGSPCGDQGIACHNNDSCDGEGSCIDKGLKAPNTPCGDSSNSECDHPDTCNAQGVCQPNYEPEDEPCGPQGVECQYDDRCDGLGQCIDRGEWTTMADPNTGQPRSCPTGHDHPSGNGCSCGTTVESECRWPDLCAAGSCVTFYKSESTSCNGDWLCNGDTGQCCDPDSPDPSMPDCM